MLVLTMSFWNNLHQVRSKSKYLKTNNLTVFGSRKTKGHKQDSQNRPRTKEYKRKPKGETENG